MSSLKCFKKKKVGSEKKSFHGVSKEMPSIGA